MSERHETGASRHTSESVVGWLGAVVDGALTALKLTVGAAAGSHALVADGLHSASDLVTDAAVLAGLRVSRQPADSDHPYGHRRISTLVGLFIGVVLFAAGVWIAYNALLALRAEEEGVSSSLAFYVALGAVPIKEALYHITHRVGRCAGDVSLQANAWHHRSDALSSAAAAAGLAAVTFGGPEWAFVDAVTALVLAAFLLLVAVRLVHRSGSELVDSAPAEATRQAIEEAVAATPGVRSHHAFRARQVGGKVEMDIHVQVDPDLTVGEGHDIASEVRRQVRKADGSVAEVIVHVEPAEPDGVGGSRLG
ncbi:MAG: cation transporter [Phycisphaerae bacterium]|nr:cation transporter [Phycisphaerae bacterium]